MLVNSHQNRKPLKIMTETGSTLYKTHAGKSASSFLQRSTFNFDKVNRTNQRLYTTVKCGKIQKGKFKLLDSSQEKDKIWAKWKYNGFPGVSQQFKKNLTKKIQKMNYQQSLGDQISSPELKLRHKIRQVLKLKDDINRARENNRLIQLIEDSHQNKINKFFDDLQKYIDEHD